MIGQKRGVRNSLATDWFWILLVGELGQHTIRIVLNNITVGLVHWHVGLLYFPQELSIQICEQPISTWSCSIWNILKCYFELLFSLCNSYTTLPISILQNSEYLFDMSDNFNFIFNRRQLSLKDPLNHDIGKPVLIKFSLTKIWKGVSKFKSHWKRTIHQYSNLGLMELHAP